ncbi:MAG TPA: hypothetical protein VKQ11_17915 [Candidatus Sulfotelmatobacter sp.]|nr:hypothetical protein [Candidatus Sulfotelmatobacter sp.]
MGFRFLAAAVFFFASLLALAQQDAPSTPASSDHSPSITAYPSAPPASAEAPVLPKVDLTPDANGKLSQQQMQQLFRVVADKDLENDKRQRDYTYIERQVEHKLDGKGQTKSTEVKTYEIVEIYGEQVERLIAKDDKPLDAKEAAKEEEKIQKIIDKRKNESEADRKKRLDKEEKEREDGRKFVTEIADAYNFTLVGTELVDGRDAWIIDGEPRPGYEPHMKEAKFLPKFHGRVWIDKNDLQLSKMQVEALDTVSWGVFLARFHKGSHFTLEQTRVNDEVWLPRQLAVKVDVRLALLKNFNFDLEQDYRDYKKFRTSSKIVGMSEVKDEK